MQLLQHQYQVCQDYNDPQISATLFRPVSSHVPHVHVHVAILSSQVWFYAYGISHVSQEIADEPPSSESDSEPKMAAPSKVKKRKRSKTKKLKKTSDAKRAVIAEENSSFSDSDDEQPPVKKKMKKR